MAIVAVLSTRSAISPSRGSWSGTSVLGSLGKVQVRVGYSGQYENNTQATVRPRRSLTANPVPSGSRATTTNRRAKQPPNFTQKKSGLTAWFFICPTIRSSGCLPNLPSIASRANPLYADTCFFLPPNQRTPTAAKELWTRRIHYCVKLKPLDSGLWSPRPRGDLETLSAKEHGSSDSVPPILHLRSQLTILF